MLSKALCNWAAEDPKLQSIKKSWKTDSLFVHLLILLKKLPHIEFL